MIISRLKSYIKLLRIHQWIKNLFLFIPVFFSGSLLYSHLFLKEFIAFICFSLAASAVYILNDYMDIEKDREHPSKKTRPLASGAVSKKEAIVLFIVLLGSALFMATFITIKFTYILLIYLLINVIYSIKLKQVSLVDIAIVSFGFLLRIFAGGVIAEVELSKWLILMTFLLSLFIVIGKRRDDLLLYQQHGLKMRASISNYNLEFVSACMVFISSVIVVAYIMYTMSPEVAQRLGHDYSYLTSLFVVFGIIRYLQRTLVENNSGDPSKIVFQDKFLLLTILGWCAFNYVLIYIK